MERMACSFFGKGSSFWPMLLGLTSASNIWRREKSWYWKSYDGSQCNRDGENRNHQQSTNQQRRTYRVINLHFDLMPPPLGRIFVSVVLVHDGGCLSVIKSLGDITPAFVRVRLREICVWEQKQAGKLKEWRSTKALRQKRKLAESAYPGSRYWFPRSKTSRGSLKYNKPLWNCDNAQNFNVLMLKQCWRTPSNNSYCPRTQQWHSLFMLV